MWKTIRQCLPSKDSTRLPCRRDPNLLAEEFNAFFTSVGSNTTDKVKQLAKDHGIQLPSPAFPITSY